MGTLDKEELHRCFHCEREAPHIVEVRVLKKGHREEATFRNNEIVFMTKGEVRFMFRDHPEKIHRKGEFIFIPLAGMFRFVVTEDTQVTVIRPNEHMSLCPGYRIEELYTPDTPVQKNSKEIFALTINRPMQLFLEGLNEAVRSGYTCRHYFDTKVREMFILLKAFYTRQQLRDFFSLILTPDTMFSEQVKKNAHKYTTAKGLADALNMTPKLFSKKFIRIFGETPTDWMRREKALCVYSDLYAGRQPIALIVDKYNFSSQPHLNKFCKREFGKNPREIQKGGLKCKK